MAAGTLPARALQPSNSLSSLAQPKPGDLQVCKPNFVSQIYFPMFFFFFFNRGGKCSKLEVWEMLEPELYLCS